MARILLHCQSLQGVGHFVRSREIARHLARSHAVWFVNGGRWVAGAPLPSSVRRHQLPPLLREQGALRAPDATATLEETLRRRMAQLRSLIREARPEVVLIEHFPFGKFGFEAEILALIAEARSRVADVTILGSVRDIPLSRELAKLSPSEQQARIEPLLRQHFDGLLVHADPGFCRLEDSFPWLADCALPVHHTGFVSQAPPARRDGPPRRPEPAAAAGTVVVSSGGLGDGGRLNRLVLEAWRCLRRRGELEGFRLVILAAAGEDPAEPGEPAAPGADGPGPGVSVRRFGPDFLTLLANADLSISQAGYNTCVNLLQLGIRSLLLPSSQVEDQKRRAQRLAELGLATLLDPETTSATQLAEAMRNILDQPICQHQLDLNGGEQTAVLVGRLSSSEGTCGRGHAGGEAPEPRD